MYTQLLVTYLLLGVFIGALNKLTLTLTLTSLSFKLKGFWYLADHCYVY